MYNLDLSAIDALGTKEEAERRDLEKINILNGGTKYKTLDEALGFHQLEAPKVIVIDRPTFTPTKALPAQKTTMGCITRACNNIRQNLHEGTVNHAKWFGQSAVGGILTVGTIFAWMFNCCSTPLGCIKFWSIMLSGVFILLMTILGILNWLCTL